MLEGKSITELRQIAQNMGVADVFAMDQAHLVQEIELRQNTPSDVAKAAAFFMEQPVTTAPDIRLLTDTPNAIVPPTDILEAIKPYMARGITVTFEGEHWHARLGKREDTGTIRMPLRDVVACMERLLA